MSAMAATRSRYSCFRLIPAAVSQRWAGAATRSTPIGQTPSARIRRPLACLAGRQRDLERVERERHQRVVAAQHDELDDATIAEELLRCLVLRISESIALHQ